jgi:pimeloyl-ACP methyl ester carboxylesterase
LRPDLRAVEVDGADHYVPEERPEAIAAIVREIDAV